MPDAFSEFSKDVAAEGNQKERHTGGDPEEALRSIMDGLAETVLEASDEEILEELYEEGVNPIEQAEEVRKVLLDAAQEYRKSIERSDGAREPSSDRSHTQRECPKPAGSQR